MKLIHLISGGDVGGAKTHVLSLLQGRPQPIERQGMLLDIPACLIISAAVMIPALACGRFKRWMGILAGALYIAYLVIMFTCFGVA